MVIASYCLLLAAMGGSAETVVVESVAASAFLLFAIFGFKRSLWWVAAAIGGHGVFDFLHPRFIENPGLPSWWPGFCLALDVVFGVVIAFRPSSSRLLKGEKWSSQKFRPSLLLAHQARMSLCCLGPECRPRKPL
jgi:hypothetical protein